ncbi:MAG TPA: hypothetical protein VF245_00825 [Solirubrobacterales bacterium]
MYPSYRLIKQVKRSAGGRVSKEGLERSLAMLEAESPTGALMSTLAAPAFREAMLDAAQCRSQAETLAWMTVAAAGPFRARRALAPRAVQVVAPHALVDALLGGGEFAEDCTVLAEAAQGEEEWGAWLLLGQLRRREARGFAEAQPALRRRLQGARRQSKRPTNSQLRDQLCALGLV